MSAPVWDDDNQPRFIEDDSDNDSGTSDKSGRPNRPGKARDVSGNGSADSPPPSASSPSDEMPASDIFMEMMRRAAATNASREQRRRDVEAKRPKPSPPTTAPPKVTEAPTPDLSLPDAPETDDRPRWQQVRDYTPPTPLERALSSLSKFSPDGVAAEPIEPAEPADSVRPVIEPKPSQPADRKSTAEVNVVPPELHPVNSRATITSVDVDEQPTDADSVTPDEVEVNTALPESDAAASHRVLRRSLAQSLAEVMIAREAVREHETETTLSDPAKQPVGQALPLQPLTDDERIADARLEAQRVRRVKKRQQQRRQRRVSVFGGVLRSFLVVVPSALLMATILSWWTDPQFLRPEIRHNIQSAIIAEGATPVPPTPFPTPNWARLIGIVSGHSGPGQTVGYDPGAVCEDLESLNEHDINMQTAIQVVRKLRDRGYVVDLMDEFDPRLNDYQAAALVSIHANTCQDYGEVVSGFLVAKAEARPEGGVDTNLAECIAKYYSNITRLGRHFGLTEDMTDYHTFREIAVDTPAAIIELGFMRADRDILNEQPDLLAEGIVQGIMCFLEPQLDTLPDATMTPTQ